MNFKRSVLLTFAVHLLVVVVDKAAGFVLLKFFEDDAPGKGVLVRLLILPWLLASVGNLGFATSIVYFLRRGRMAVEPLAQTGAFLAAVWGTVVAAGALGFSLWVGRADPHDGPVAPMHLLLPMLALLPALLTTSYFNSIQLAHQRIRRYNLVHLVGSVLFLPLFLAAVLLGAPPLEAAVYSRFLVAAGACVVAVRLARDLATWRPRFHKEVFRKGLAYGWRANLNSILASLHTRANVYLVGFLFLASREARDAEVAFYSLAMALAELVWHLPEAMRDLVFNRVAGQTPEEARQFTPVVCRNVLLVSAVGAAVVWFLADPLLGLYLRTWEDTWAPRVLPALAWLLPGTLAFTIGKLLQADFAAQGRINQAVALAGLTLAVLVALGVLWIPSHGAAGAAAASTAAYAAGTLYGLAVYGRLTGTPWHACLVPRIGDLVHYRIAWRETMGRMVASRAGGDVRP